MAVRAMQWIVKDVFGKPVVGGYVNVDRHAQNGYRYLGLKLPIKEGGRTPLTGIGIVDNKHITYTVDHPDYLPFRADYYARPGEINVTIDVILMPKTPHPDVSLKVVSDIKIL